jgi:hypothetical protein
MVHSAFLLLLLANLSSAHYDRAYFRDPDDGFVDRKSWMASIPDSVKLNEMAIPGTHDSAAWGGYFNDILYTQCLNFQEQLNYGYQNQAHSERLRAASRRLLLKRQFWGFSQRSDDVPATVQFRDGFVSISSRIST